MKKVIIVGPILSRSGYGEMARFALNSLKNVPDIELFVLPTNWGNTGWLHENNAERVWIDELVVKTALRTQQMNGNPDYDISIQISIPNEWKKIAPINIGYTAGIETNLISPAWLQPSLSIDKIIVISEHAKAGFINTIFGNPQGQQFRVTTPVEVVHLPYRDCPKKTLELNLKHDFNFLAICQWGPRKNLEQTIVGFLEEFRNENVGLVLKVNTANDSITDRTFTQKRLHQLLSNYYDRKCSVTLIHGHLSEGEMESLYVHPKIKAIVSTTHGEGFGLPFLWKGVLEEGTQWAFPKTASYKDKLRDCYKDYGRYKSQAKKLAPWVKDNFAVATLANKFFNIIESKQDGIVIL